MQAITFIDYEKISDDLYFLGQNVLLRFNVQLAKKSDDGRRFHYHKEYEYNSNKYIDKSNLVSIRRSFDYYLSLERTVGDRESIMIRAQDMIILRGKINQATKWYFNNNLYAVKKDKLIMLGKQEPIKITNLAGSKWIMLEPTILQYENQYTPGLRLYLSSESNYIDISVDKFMGLVYLIDSINMYESAQLLLNYLQRPQFGTNLYSFENEISKEKEPDVKAKNRTIQKSNKSYFDKLDEL